MKRFVTLLFCVLVLSVTAQNTVLYIPDTLTGPNYSLTMHEDSVQFFQGLVSHTYGYNSNKYLGPTLIFKRGTAINITVNNQIQDTTTVHWHGIHVPANYDGGPHSEILPSATWNPQFTVLDNAATYWYHPHPDMKTAQQAIKGAAGLIIVRDSLESSLALPRRYGIDDFPIIVQCQQYDFLNQAMPRGMQDSTLLVNGAKSNNGDTVVGNFPAQIVRMRLLNASGERSFNFGFSANKQFYQIASDGGLLDAPFATTRVQLAPGERAELLLDLNGMQGQTISLKSYASELAMGIQGGPTMPMPPGFPPMDSPLNGIDFDVMQIKVGPPTANAINSVPLNLVNNNPYSELLANVTRTIRFTADSLMVMDGPFYFNDSAFNMMRIDYEIPLNSIEIWKLVNETMVAHPFHLHDVEFFILDRNGNVPLMNELGRKDVVLVPPGDSLRFIVKFTDFADSLVPYMFHCHILMHEDDGMMGQFLVLPNAVGVSEVKNNTSNCLLFPNPTNDFFRVKLNNGELIQQLVLFDLLGIKCLELNGSEFEKVDISELSPGQYFLQIKTRDTIYYKKINKL